LVQDAEDDALEEDFNSDFNKLVEGVHIMNGRATHIGNRILKQNEDLKNMSPQAEATTEQLRAGTHRLNQVMGKR
jgi:hypothetical protein